jgi:hypothetical protein
MCIHVLERILSISDHDDYQFNLPFIIIYYTKCNYNAHSHVVEKGARLYNVTYELQSSKKRFRYNKSFD